MAQLNSELDPTNPLIQYAMMQEIKNIPRNNEFHAAMGMWQWVTIDGAKVPCVFRKDRRYTASRIIQIRLLSRFPPNMPQDMTQRFVMSSHKMLVLEAWIFNTVNAVDCHFEFGYQLFTPNDEIVAVDDAERYCFALKAHNLSRMADQYQRESVVVQSLHENLSQHLTCLHAKLAKELQVVMQRLDAAEKRAQKRRQVIQQAAISCVDSTVNVQI